MSYRKHHDPQQAQNRLAEFRRPHLEKLAASRLKPLDRSQQLKIRHKDLPVFESTAEIFDHIIIVRASNVHSLQYVGQKGFAPKPIDCKPKTADSHVWLDHGQSYCAGLVVDPTLTGDKAFSDKRKEKARESWREFLQAMSEREIHHKVFLRRGESGGIKGFYAVDTYPGSRHFGCLMLSEQNRPSRDFRLSLQEWQPFKQQHLRYIHGDYDLYGLIDTQADTKMVHKAPLHGLTNIFTHRFHEIQEHLNQQIGADMIQHGSEDNRGHTTDELYVFLPGAGIYYMQETADAIEEVYRLLWDQDGSYVLRSP